MLESSSECVRRRRVPLEKPLPSITRRGLLEAKPRASRNENPPVQREEVHLSQIHEAVWRPDSPRDAVYLVRRAVNRGVCLRQSANALDATVGFQASRSTTSCLGKSTMFGDVKLLGHKAAKRAECFHHEVGHPVTVGICPPTSLERKCVPELGVSFEANVDAIEFDERMGDVDGSNVCGQIPN